MGRIWRTVWAVAVVAAALTLLPGWFTVSLVPGGEAQTVAQLDVIGDVQITTVACVSSTFPCPDGSSGEDLPGFLTQKQFLLAYRVSAAVEPPATIEGVLQPLGLPVVFTQRPDYAAQLNGLAPAAPDTKWVGYMTPAVTNADLSGNTLLLAPRFRLLRGTNGSAFTGPFLYRTVTGARLVNLSRGPTRPVVCGPTLTTAGDVDTTWCADWPSSGNVVPAPLLTHDLGVLPAGSGQGTPGGTAQAEFTLDFAGDPGPAFALAATTTLPGATASVATPFTPAAANEDKAAPVQVPIPAGATPGTYVVTLTATVGAQTRSASAQITVLPGPPPPPPPPSFTLTGTPVQAAYRSGLLRGAILLRGAAGQATTLRVSLTRRQTRSTNEPAAITRTITVADGPFEERFALPARLGPGAYLLRVTPTAGALALAEEVRNIVIPGPPNGLVQRAVFSSRPNGSASTRLPRPRPALFVRFVFSSLPLPRRPITITFLGPNGRRAAPAIGKPRARVVAAEIRARPSLPAGRWRAVLRVRGVVVATATVRIA